MDMYTTQPDVEVPVNLTKRLDEMAFEQKVTCSELVRIALAAFAAVDISTWRKDYREKTSAAAVEIIRQFPKARHRAKSSLLLMVAISVKRHG